MFCYTNSADFTLGALGTTAEAVEEELEKNFSLAARWGCILLLDEADVFLSARERMDFKRNGLVASKYNNQMIILSPILASMKFLLGHSL